MTRFCPYCQVQFTPADPRVRYCSQPCANRARAATRLVERPLIGDWVLQAKCRGTDPELFFPSRGDESRHAKQVCVGCPVIAECLEYALEAGEKFGVWGGKSERERRRMRRQRTRAA